MSKSSALSSLALALAAALGILRPGAATPAQDSHPTVITPGAVNAAPPSDALVLFDGSDLSHWTKRNGEPAGWVLDGEAMIAVKGQGPVISKETFSDAQIHLEFATPSDVQGSGQGRGNSGVYLQGRYEVQILDSFENETYANGQCAAVYGHHPPLVNACREPGQWQSYDIVFHGPRWAEDGSKLSNATVTVFHNGVLVQDHVEVPASTAASMNREGPGEGPLYLQDHGNPVRYRNVWMRKL